MNSTNARTAFRQFACFAAALSIAVVLAPVGVAQELPTAAAVSPNGRLSVRVGLRRSFDNRPELIYEVFQSGKPLLLPSSLGVRLKDGTNLGTDCTIVNAEPRELSERFRQFPGKRQFVDSHCNELQLFLKENASPPREWQVVVRAYDEGIALRYQFPRQSNWQELELAAERTQFSLPHASKALFLPLDGFVSSHEGLYQQQPISQTPKYQLLDVPLLIEVPQLGSIAIGEANLTNYAGMTLTPTGDSALAVALSPRIDEPAIAVRGPLPLASPWRVIQFAEQAKGLIESDLLLKLNAPSQIADTSWIKPGKTTFPWWNGFYEENVPFELGLNTKFAKHYIDFCAEYGIPYHSLDGLENTAWYGGPIAPYEGNDPTTAVDGLDLPDVLAYAKAKGTRLRLWLHWQAAQAHMERAFPLYRDWGIEGVMIDFMDRNDQDMVSFQRRLLQLAAESHLTVTFHGVAAPTGLERTFPNLLNSEAVMNLEYNKWKAQGVPPEHDVTVPFTRMLAGPMDYHQGSFRTIPPAEFQPRETAPLVIGAPGRMLASYIVFQNHLPMVADYPSAYRRHPLTKVLTTIPATWDDTKVLVGEVGQYVVIARRAGDDWWIGAMTNGEARALSVPLEFLDTGNYRAEVHQDEDSSHRHSRTEIEVSADSVLTLALAAAGGALVRLTPAPADPPGWKLVWSDDFEKLDPESWRVGDDFLAPSAKNRAYEPNLVSIAEGKLALEAEKTQFGRAVSKFAQRYGRWEVRAQIPPAAGLKSLIRLLPDAPWPSQGEIDIMTSNGAEPTITNSEFHWGAGEPFFHGARSIPQRAAERGQLVSFPDGFHTYAVEWTPDQLRYYVDDLYHTVFYSDEVGDVLPKLALPMHLSLDLESSGNTAQTSSGRMLIDWVRVYEADPTPKPRHFLNGGFESRGGSLTGWHIFANRMTGTPNVLPAWQGSRSGNWSLALSGQSSDADSYAGVSQGISVSPRQTVRASLFAKTDAADGLATTKNRVSMKIEFYKQLGSWFGGPAMLDAQEIVIADRSTPPDEWRKHTLEMQAPAEAVEARLSLVFAQFGNEPGTVYVDDVEFASADQ